MKVGDTMKKLKPIISIFLSVLAFNISVIGSFCQVPEFDETVDLDRQEIELIDIERQEIEIEDSEMMMLRSTGSGNATLFVSAGQWVADNFYEFCNWVAHGYVSLSYDAVGDNVTFHWWLDNEADPEEAQEFEESEVEITSDGNYNVPQNVQQTVLNYIEYRIQQNPLTYKQAYIKSYNYLSPNQFSNYGLYKSIQEFIKNADGFVAIHGENRNGVWDPSLNNSVYVIPKTINMGLYGSVTNGSMSAQLAVNWQTSGKPQNIDNRIKCYTFNGSGQFTAVQTCYRDLGYLKNPNTITSGSTTDFTLFTSMNESELVYVFSNLNAYKNYNSGYPQNYYYTQQGIETPLSSWTATGGSLIAGQDLTYYGQTYSTISQQTQTGWTAEQVLQLVESIMSGSGGSSGGSGGSGDGSDFDLGFLGTIGRLIGSLITGIGNLLTGVLEGIVNVIIGEDGNGGIVGTVRNVITNLLDLFDNDFAELFSTVFDWLPPEIITLITAALTFSLLFGIIKMIRG